MEPMPRFELFEDPVREGIVEASEKTCDVCGLARGAVYNGQQFGEGDDLVVCPWCIADGSAAARGRVFNVGEVYPLLPGTPQLTDEDKAMVEQRTPGYRSWQQLGWTVCCGRACLYLGEATQTDLRERWAEVVPTLEDASAYAEGDVVSEVRPDGHISVYVFRCQVCGKMKGLWDCD